ncbi:hypothetical protein GXW74_23275 [Roseomonas eburnea]|uniref:Uncharacterized protein n=1 Tax=Neoroseomonas eburnea TaxID=1346889 RepID=A0A9X9XI91_9PROT|nr:hypothetical protein [Neoroseomonas eburnea]MBR0683427.1 hypothetical protein [Neoroseomonas eburnea]
MEILRTFADISIRRACGFAALGIGTVMLALSYDLALALRSGAVLTSLTFGVIWLCAWRAPHWDVRRTELWSMVVAEGLHLPSSGTHAARLEARAARVLRERLSWHAERVALAALAMWICAGGAALVDHLLGE